ncbi:MAG: hypothetical protein JSR37_10410 [Verrucomicrobia bacterium]|nr:hypothetical protein [Verrucomicrobiota bacterium]
MAKKKERFSEEVIYQLDCLLEYASAQELREYLLELYQCYIIHEHEMLPANFPEMARSLQILFDFLRVLNQEETQPQPLKRKAWKSKRSKPN